MEERLNPHNFVYDFYLSEYLKATYSHTLRSINGDDMCEKGPAKMITTAYFTPKKKTKLESSKEGLRQGK